MKGLILVKIGMAVFFIIAGAYNFTNAIHDWTIGQGTGWTWFWFSLGAFVMGAWSVNAAKYWGELEDAYKKGK